MLGDIYQKYEIFKPDINFLCYFHKESLRIEQKLYEFLLRSHVWLIRIR